MLISEEVQASRYASVSREWQAAVERKTFASIKLTTPYQLAEFAHMVRNRSRLVKYIWLSIPVPNKTTHPNFEGDRLAVQRWFQVIFDVIGEWQPGGGLTLDISARDVGDAHSMLALDALQADDEESDYAPAPTSHARFGNDGDQKLGILFRRFRLIDASKKVFWLGVPRAHAVTRLLLRRQTRRQWSPRTLFFLLLHLPALQEIWWEPWRDLTKNWTGGVDHGTSRACASMTMLQCRRELRSEQLSSIYFRKRSPRRSKRWSSSKTTTNGTRNC